MSAGDGTQADVAYAHKERSGAPLHMLDVPNADGAQQILQRAHPSPLPYRAPGRALWQSSRTTGTVMLGVHMVTTPLAWPRHCTPFQGLCRMASQGPSFVRCCATICPVLVSCAVHADLEAAPPPPLAASGSCLSPALQARGHSTAVRPRLTMHSCPTHCPACHPASPRSTNVTAAAFECTKQRAVVNVCCHGPAACAHLYRCRAGAPDTAAHRPPRQMSAGSGMAGSPGAWQPCAPAHHAPDLRGTGAVTVRDL